MYFLIKLGRHVNHDERMDPTDFGGQRSKVKVTVDTSRYTETDNWPINSTYIRCIYVELIGQLSVSVYLHVQINSIG